jgi:hypothetical protein
MNELIEKARENILSDEIGKFDLLESVFPLEFLLTQKPRHVKKKVCETLFIDPDQINYNGFMSWIKRLRKKHPGMRRTVVKPYTDKTDKEDWRNFQPSEPVPMSELNNNDVLKKITYQ